MKKLAVLALSALMLTPVLCLAAPDEHLLICGKIKETMTYRNKAKKINYRYVIIEEYDNIDDMYDRHLPYGLYMFRVAHGVDSLGNCFEIDTRKNLVVSSTVGD